MEKQFILSILILYLTQILFQYVKNNTVFVKSNQIKTRFICCWIKYNDISLYNTIHLDGDNK